MARYDRSYPRSRGRPRPIRMAQLLLAAGILLLLFWLILSGVRLVRAATSLQRQQQRLESLLEAGILNADAAELEQIALTVREDVMAIDRVVGPFAPLGRYFDWLPGVGPLLADAQPLLEMADASTEIAIYGVAIADPFLAEGQEAGLTESLPQVIQALDQSERQLRRADAVAERLFEARAALEHEDQYPDRISALLRRFDEHTALLHDGLKLAQVAPELLGLDRPKIYLILAQNEDELRPAGGFISGAGLLTVDQGQIRSISFDDAYGIDDWRNKPYDLPPEPFSQFMGMDIFLFRDANFWPDFARSAAQAQALYTYGQEMPLDGVVAIDQHFLQQLLAVTGPLPVPDLGRIVDAANLINQLREEWGPAGDGEDWIVQRKAFMGPLAAALLAQWAGGSLSINGLDLMQMLQRAAQQRHLQLYSSDPAAASLLDETAWSGRLNSSYTAGDFLHVADTNLGFNKVNASIQRSLAYEITVDGTGRASARLDVHYSNPPAAESVECQHGTSYDIDTRYESLTSDCYWNYLRAYVPLGSQLVGASQHPVPAANLMSGLEWPGVSRTGLSHDGSFTVFDNFILLGTGQQTTVSFEYILPETVLQYDGGRYHYRLHVRKQAGTTAEPVTVRLTIPERSSVDSVTPQPNMIDGNRLLFELILESDVTIEVAFLP